jgi:hypothetical protein
MAHLRLFAGDHALAGRDRGGEAVEEGGLACLRRSRQTERMGNAPTCAFASQAHRRRRLRRGRGRAAPLERPRRALGIADLHAFLATRCQHGDTSLPQLAEELGTTVAVLRRLLSEADIQRPPQHAGAVKRRHTTDQRMTTRAAGLGFSTLKAYLADRVVDRGWPLAEVVGEFGVHARTVRSRLNTYGLRRQRPTPRQAAANRHAAKQRTARWQAQRAARLAALGFADIDAYLRARRAEQGWSVRRMRAELQVDRAWLTQHMDRLGLQRP